MIFTLVIKLEDGARLLRVESDDDTGLARLSFKTFVTRNQRSYDAASRTWRVEPEGVPEVLRWHSYLYSESRDVYLQTEPLSHAPGTFAAGHKVLR